MIVIITVPGTPPIVASIKEEDDTYITVEYPIIFMKEDPYVYTSPYLPFADNTNVIFSKNNIIATSNAHKEIQKHYKTVVNEFKKQKLSFKDPAKEQEEEKKAPIPDFKPKTFH